MGKPGHEMTPQERWESHNRHEAYADQVMEMFARGDSYSQISKATGIPRSTVGFMCQRLSAEYARQRYGDTTAILGRELQILDSLTRANLGRARNGDEGAARIVLAVRLRVSKLLGIDAAQKTELTVRTATDIEIERLIAMMGAQSDPGAGGSLDPVGASESPGDAHTAPDATA